MERSRRDFAAFFAFIAPALFFYLVFFIVPIPTSIYFSLFKWSGIAGDLEFIGLRNYRFLLQDSILWKSVGNNFKLAIFSVVFQIPLGILLGLLATSGLPLTRTFKLLYFVPMMISAIAVAVTWRLIYDPFFGLIVNLFKAIGIEGVTGGWLAESESAFNAVFVAISWQSIPFYMILFSAALSGVPSEILEAATIDGAASFARFFRITLPLIFGTIRTASILAIIGSLQYFGLVWVLTKGGPANSTELMSTMMYRRAFFDFRSGMASTIAVFMFVISITVTVTILKLTQRGVLENE